MKGLKGWIGAILVLGVILAGSSWAAGPTTGAPAPTPLLELPIYGVPGYINVQGRATTTAGAALSGAQTIIFRIFKVSTSGTAIWAKTYTVDIPAEANGIFNEIIGSTDDSGVAFPMFETNRHYLEIVLNGTRLSPRQRLVAVPYAINARNVIGSASRKGRIAVYNEGTVISGHATGTDIEDKGVSGSTDGRGAGIYGTSLRGYGVQGYKPADSTASNAAVQGSNHRSTAGDNPGVRGYSRTGYGVYGRIGPSGKGGVYGQYSDPNIFGELGVKRMPSHRGSFKEIGVYGQAYGIGDYGVLGVAENGKGICAVAHHGNALWAEIANTNAPGSTVANTNTAAAAYITNRAARGSGIHVDANDGTALSASNNSETRAAVRANNRDPDGVGVWVDNGSLKIDEKIQIAAASGPGTSTVKKHKAVGKVTIPSGDNGIWVHNSYATTDSLIFATVADSGLDTSSFTLAFVDESFMRDGRFFIHIRRFIATHVDAAGPGERWATSHLSSGGSLYTWGDVVVRYLIIN